LNIKPIKISLFLLLILSVLFGITFLSEKGAIKKNQIEEDGFYFSGISIKYPTYETFLGSEKTATITKEDVLKVTNIVTPISETSLDASNKKDSIDLAMKKGSLSKPDFSTIDTTQIQRIIYPVDNPEFVQQLKSKLSSESCRIIHYGDSQLEGDRITGYLRNRLQGMYGGNGPGFLPLKPVYDQVAAEITPSKNWFRYAKFDPTKKKLKHKKYGAYMSVSRFTEYAEVLPDSIAIDSFPIVKAFKKIV